MKFFDKDAKIYSRWRFRIPRVQINSDKISKEKKRLASIITIMVIAIITAYTMIKAVNPIIESKCKDTAKNIAVQICNEQTKEIIKNYTYDDLINVTKNNNGDITMVQANTTNIGKITTQIPLNIAEALKEDRNSTITIYLGSIFGIKILSGIGPKINAKIASSGNVRTEIKSEFEANAINQTIHRLYLEIKMEVTILTPYNVVVSDINNKVLLTESIIVGNVPDSYYDLNTKESSNSLKIIK